MKWIVRKSSLAGSINIPASKSHTIRSLAVATLAKGKSRIANALTTGDGASAISAARSMGATVKILDREVLVTGVSGDFNAGLDTFAMENSGTSTNLFASIAALGSRRRRFDGDKSLRTRPFKPVLEALGNLGVKFGFDRQGSDLPFWVQGPLLGGTTVVNGFSSQFVSSLLFACPCASSDTVLTVENLHERPYVEMTLRWLDMLGICYEASADLCRFRIRGGQSYRSIQYTVPGDFSTATFAAVAAPLVGANLELRGIDFGDSQGDKGVFEVISRMGARIAKQEFAANVDGRADIHGVEIDLNAMPDALPALSVLACKAEGETAIVNVAQARVKETDRIAVMAAELSAMGADVQERPDGLVIRTSKLKGANVKGHCDHRVVMALALAGMIADGETVIDTAEAAAVTYPSFVKDFQSLGANIKVVE
jgi:3-phosphoshikimate 1-carboxyvinyltransferase